MGGTPALRSTGPIDLRTEVGFDARTIDCIVMKSVISVYRGEEFDA